MIQQSHFWILIPRKIESRSQRDISPPTFTAAFFIVVKQWKQPKYVSTHEK